MRHRKQQWISTLCIFLFLGSLTACGEGAIDLSSLRAESGEYRYRGLDWGSSVEDTEKAVGLSLSSEGGTGAEGTDYRTSTDYDYATFVPEKELGRTVRVHENQGTLRFYFSRGQLNSVSYDFVKNTEGNDLQKLWDGLKKDLTAEFGDGYTEENRDTDIGKDGSGKLTASPDAGSSDSSFSIDLHTTHLRWIDEGADRTTQLILSAAYSGDTLSSVSLSVQDIT